LRGGRLPERIIREPYLALSENTLTLNLFILNSFLPVLYRGVVRE